MSNDLSLWGGARRDVWNYLLRYARETNGHSPTMREIVANVPGVASTSGASWHLDILEQYGLVEKLVGKSRGVIIVDSKWEYTGAYPEKKPREFVTLPKSLRDLIALEDPGDVPLLEIIEDSEDD